MTDPQACEHENIASVGKMYICAECNIGLSRDAVQDVIKNDEVDLAMAFRRTVLAMFVGVRPHGDSNRS